MSSRTWQLGTLLVTAALVSAVACGGKSGGAAGAGGGTVGASAADAGSGAGDAGPTDAGSAAVPDAGVATPDGGVTTGGAPDAGISGVPADGGTGSGSSSGAGGGGDGSAGQGGGATGGTSTSGGGSVSGAPDAGTGTAGGVIDCGALLASPGTAIELDFDTGTHAACELATGAPDGRVALGIRGGAFSSAVSFSLYSADGTHWLGSLFLLIETVTPDVDPWFHWTDRGWAGLVHDTSVAPPQALRSWDGEAHWLGDLPQQYVVSTAPTADGGSVILQRPWDGNHAPYLGRTSLAWVNGAGQVQRSVPLDDDPRLVLTNWGTGHVVTIVPDATHARARWYDGTGAALTPWFELGVPLGTTTPVLHLLVDGSVAVGDGQLWRALLRDGVASADPPPAWLGARPGTRLGTIRQGRAYAVLPNPNGQLGAADQTRFEIVTPAGESCGWVSLPPPPANQYGPVSPQRIDLGQEGTVFQTEMLAGPAASGVHCAFRWWPALLR